MKLKYITLSIILASTSNIASAGMDSEMNAIFGAMVNTTSPTAYKNAQRGVIGGGQLYVTLPKKSVDIVSMTAPHVSMGCGGINLYGGSFSMLSADELLENFRAIGTAAVVYGVKTAIVNACGTCEQVMTSLEKTAQFFNKMNLDSCQAAEGIVTKLFDDTNDKSVVASATSVVEGYVDDFSKIWSGQGSKSTTPEAELKQKNPQKHKELVTGNYVWRALKTNQKNIKQAFPGLNDDKSLELLMSMSGTTVISQPSTNKQDKPISLTYRGGLVKLKDLVNGGKVIIYNCGNNKSDKNACLNPTLSERYTVTLPSMAERVSKGFNAIIDAYKNNTAWNNDAKQAASLKSRRGSFCINQFRNLMSVSNDNELYAKGLANECSSIVALEGMAHLYDEYLTAVERSIMTIPMDQQEKAYKDLTKSRNLFRTEYNQLLDATPNNYRIEEVEAVIKQSKKNANTFSN
ncbi:hypothetical protein I8Y06_003336 [Photobacterium damselae]|nr:hypothetical protein [Photobacterium damselae]